MSNAFMQGSAPVGGSPINSFLNASDVTSVRNRHKEFVKDPKKARDLMIQNNVDIEFAASVAIPTELLHDKNEIDKCKGGVHVASGKISVLSARLRTGVSFQLCSNIVEQFGQNRELSEAIIEKCGNSFSVSAGAIASIGRFMEYAPKKGVTGIKPPSVIEVRLAKKGVGMPDTRNNVIPPFGVVDTQTDEPMIRVANKSGLGYPTLSRTDNREAVEVHQYKAYAMLMKLGECDDYDEMRKVLLEDKQKTPEWYVYRGKAKADVYARDKVLSDKLRLYFEIPAWLRFGIASVLQPFELQCENILTSSQEREDLIVHTAYKVSFAHGGAMMLVLKLQEHLKRFGYGFTNNGDDTMICFRLGDRILVGSVDASSFDLTQRFEVMQPLKRALYEKLVNVDPNAAGLYRFVKEEPKTVALFDIGTYNMKHCSPSGVPGTSLENSMLMNVFCQRLVNAWKVLVRTHEDLDSMSFESVTNWFSGAVQIEGEGLGLTVRIDELDMCPYEVVTKVGSEYTVLDGLLGFLSRRSFLYLGYELFCDARGAVVPYQSLPRAISNLMYPTTAYIKDDTTFRLYDILRLIGSVVNMGHYPKCILDPQASTQIRQRAWAKLPVVFVDGELVVVPIMDVMCSFLRTYVEQHASELLDMQSTKIDYVNPFAGVDFPSTLRGLMAVLGQPLFYPFNDEIESMWNVNTYSFKSEQKLTEGDVRNYLDMQQDKGQGLKENGVLEARALFEANEGELMRIKPRVIKIAYVASKRKWMDPKADFFGKMPPLVGPVATLKQLSAHTIRAAVVKKGQGLKGFVDNYEMGLEGEKFDAYEEVYEESVDDVDSKYFKSDSSDTDDYRKNWMNLDSDSDFSDDEDPQQEERDLTAERQAEYDEYAYPRRL